MILSRLSVKLMLVCVMIASAGAHACSPGFPGNPGSGGTGGSNGGDRLILEGNLVQRENDRIYALGDWGGVSIIDASAANLKVLGRFRTPGKPLEMYVRSNALLLALFAREGAWNVRSGIANTTTQLVVLDARDPAQIQKLKVLEMPGELADSRVVGNALYVVTYRRGYGSFVTGIDFSDPRNVRKAAELEVLDAPSNAEPRAVVVSESRLYLAHFSDETVGTTLRLIDISRANGDLVFGGRVELEGTIENRWQLDEYRGVLRVIAQPQPWNADQPPVVRTFRIEPSRTLTPLGQLALRLPEFESLRHVRFEGSRGYAVTGRSENRLVTIDLAEPALPRQVAELVLSGFLSSMQPRGDRMLGLATDEGSIQVSLFDVGNLVRPKLLQRVNFGTQSELPKDDTVVHDVLRPRDERGALLVPFSTRTAPCNGYQHGVELVDYTRDTLSAGGFVQTDPARRAMLQRDTLFSLSSSHLQSFDVANRDTRRLLDEVVLSQGAEDAAGTQNHVVRIGFTSLDRPTTLDVLPRANAATADPVGSIQLFGPFNDACNPSLNIRRLFTSGERAYVVSDRTTIEGGAILRGSRNLAVVDVSNAASPKMLVEKAVSTPSADWLREPADSVGSGEPEVLLSDTTFAFLGLTPDFSQFPMRVTAWLDIVDVSNPASISTSRVDLPFATGLMGLHVDGRILLMSHYEPAPADPAGRVFYLDRVDVSNPKQPRLLEKRSIPGSLLAWDSKSRRALTVDYQTFVAAVSSSEECNELGNAKPEWKPNPGACTAVRHTVRQVHVTDDSVELEGSWEVPDGLALGDASVGDDRVFMSLHASYIEVPLCFGTACVTLPPPPKRVRVVTFSGLQSGALRAAVLDLAPEPSISAALNHLSAFGQRALATTALAGDSLLVIDAAGPEAPSIQRTVPGLGPVSKIEKAGNLALVTLRERGFDVIDMNP
jgi:hypothetical protein